jgi:response regulator RpfG family c-di-GMP phosphodiesterase
MTTKPGYGVKKKFAEDQALHDVIALLFNLYELMCPALLEHSRELAHTCESLAKALHWDKEGVRNAFLGGLFHDVGHLMSPGDILNWKGETPPPRPHMETEHPEYGEMLIKRVKCLAPIRPAIRSHHELYNGSGFPDGLSGHDIPEIARLIAVAHHYQTLLRGYHNTPPMPYKDTVQVMEDDAGVLLDPEMTKVFIARVAC